VARQDVVRALVLRSEVDRLRIELAESETRRKDLFKRLGEEMDDHGDTRNELAETLAEHERCPRHLKGYAEAKLRGLKRDHAALAAKVEAATELHWPTTIDGRRDLVCGNSADHGAWRHWPCPDARALGLDQKGNTDA
jgi:hypothetical protein